MDHSSRVESRITGTDNAKYVQVALIRAVIANIGATVLE